MHLSKFEFLFSSVSRYSPKVEALWLFLMVVSMAVLLPGCGSGGSDGTKSGSEDEPDSGYVYEDKFVTYATTHAMSDHTTTLLKDGTVLVAGGADDANVLNAASLYDPETGLFTLLPAGVVHARNRHAAVRLEGGANDGKVLITGGDGVSGDLDSAELYDPVAKTFTEISAMTTARQGHTATRLDSGIHVGKVLIIGGAVGGTTLDSAELYNPATGNFEPTGDFSNYARKEHTATQLVGGADDGKVLITGGRQNTSRLDSAFLYDPDSGVFTDVATLDGGARFRHKAVRLEGGPNHGKVLLTGGRSALSVTLNSAELYDPATRTFSTLDNTMTITRESHAATRLDDGKVLITAGYDGGTQVLSRVELYDPASNSFAVPASVGMKHERAGHTATRLTDDSLLIVGGSDDYGFLNSAELYEMDTGLTQELLDSLDRARSNHAAVLLEDETVLITGGETAGMIGGDSVELYRPGSGFEVSGITMTIERLGHTATLLGNGRVLITGGESSGSVTNSAELYDPDNPGFTVLSGMNSPRSGHTATLLADGTTVLIAGGYDGSGTLASAELYHPATDEFELLPGLMDHNRKNHATVELEDGRILITGGTDSIDDYLAIAEVYDPTTRSFVALTDIMVQPRADHTATLIDGGVVMITGGRQQEGYVYLPSYEFFF